HEGATRSLGGFAAREPHGWRAAEVSPWRKGHAGPDLAEEGHDRSTARAPCRAAVVHRGGRARASPWRRPFGDPRGARRRGAGHPGERPSRGDRARRHVWPRRLQPAPRGLDQRTGRVPSRPVVSFSRERFRAISGSFPTGVVIIATLDDHGQPKGLTSQAYVGLSTEPPLMLVSIDRTSRTLPALQKHRAFVINFLKAGAEDVATLFASKADDKFKDLRWEPSAEAGGAPILRGLSLAYAACRATEIHEAGAPVMFLGGGGAEQAVRGATLRYHS